jgi:hypothetical protein
MKRLGREYDEKYIKGKGRVDGDNDKYSVDNSDRRISELCCKI